MCKPVEKPSNLFNLMPYIDEVGLLRVYGRIDAASYLPFGLRRPIILPKGHDFTKLVVMHYHCQTKHQHHETTICEIRKRFWIPQLRSFLKSVVSKCQQCNRPCYGPSSI